MFLSGAWKVGFGFDKHQERNADLQKMFEGAGIRRHKTEKCEEKNNSFSVTVEHH